MVCLPLVDCPSGHVLAVVPLNSTLNPCLRSVICVSCDNYLCLPVSQIRDNYMQNTEFLYTFANKSWTISWCKQIKHTKWFWNKMFPKRCFPSLIASLDDLSLSVNIGVILLTTHSTSTTSLSPGLTLAHRAISSGTPGTNSLPIAAQKHITQNCHIVLPTTGREKRLWRWNQLCFNTEQCRPFSALNPELPKHWLRLIISALPHLSAAVHSRRSSESSLYASHAGWFHINWMCEISVVDWISVRSTSQIFFFNVCLSFAHDRRGFLYS